MVIVRNVCFLILVHFDDNKFVIAFYTHDALMSDDCTKLGYDIILAYNRCCENNTQLVLTSHVCRVMSQ